MTPKGSSSDMSSFTICVVQSNSKVTYCIPINNKGAQISQGSDQSSAILSLLSWDSGKIADIPKWLYLLFLYNVGG